MNKTYRAWLEAMRLRTLPVSIAGVITGGAVAIAYGCFHIIPFLICLIFAIMSQIVSNFANEYFDYKNGLDKKGREGFRRGVTEGDISPKTMCKTLVFLIIATCLIGCILIKFGGLILIPFGILIAIGAVAYSAGPYPLSHHGLGDIAVFIFYGIIPVFFTAYVQIPDIHIWPLAIILGSAIGLMGINVLIVNNYRDYYDDKSVGKNTTVVIFGRNIASTLYFSNGILAICLYTLAIVSTASPLWLVFLIYYANRHYILWKKLTILQGRELNPLLGQTAKLMLITSIWIIAVYACQNICL